MCRRESLGPETNERRGGRFRAIARAALLKSSAYPRSREPAGIIGWGKPTSQSFLPAPRFMSYPEMVTHRSLRISLAKDAIEVVVSRLATLPSSQEVEKLRAKAVEYLREADGWEATAPTAKESETLMKRVLNLHIRVAKLNRRS
jgi:hypothetical protein